MRKFVLALLTATTLASCTTTITVKKVTVNKDGVEQNVEGLRYYLPRPYLLVTPGADGTITVTKKYLPDLDRQYAVTSKSYLAKHKLNVDISDEGFLTAFGSKSDSTDFAKATLEKATEFLKARADAETTAAQKQKDALAAAEDALAKAQAAVDAINLELTEIENSQVGEDKKKELMLNARIRLAKATIDLQNATKARDALRGSSANIAGGSSTLNEAGQSGTHKSPGNFDMTWGPVLLRIVDDGKSVRLKPVQWPVTVATTTNDTTVKRKEKRDQTRFATQTIKPDEAKPAKVTPKGKIRLRLPETADDLVFTIETDTDLLEVNGTLTILRKDDEPIEDAVVVLQLDPVSKREIKVTLPKALARGTYRLTFPVKVTENGKPEGKEMEVVFEVVKK
jgi:hypothetical protein